MERIKRRHHGICGVPTWVTLEYTLVTVICLLQTVGVYGNSSQVNLTATDAHLVLGGYVVPVNGSITLHCEAQGPDYDMYTSLQWSIAMGAFSRERASLAVIVAASKTNKFTALSNVDNPSILRAHNLLLSENGSIVQCLIANDPTANWSHIVKIYVEDIPNCVGHLNTSSTDDLIVTWNSYDGLLPVMYNISIWSTNNVVVVSNSTMDPNFHLNEFTYSLQSNTTYFVLVTTCTSAGCSQDCGNITIRTGDLHGTHPDSNPTKVEDMSTSSSDETLAIFIVVPVAVGVALFTIILIVVVLLSWSIVWRIQRKNKQSDHQEEYFTIENRCNLKSQTVCQNGTMEEYATVSDAKEKRHLPSSPLSVQSSTPQNVVDMEGYGVVQNAAKSPQRVRSLGSQRHRVNSDVPEPMHYAEVNGCCAQTKPPLSRSQSNPQHHTVVTPTTPLPPEYAEVPDTIRTRHPVQRSCSIPTASSIEEGPPIPPRGYIQSPENSEVIDAGYASLPHQNAPSRVTKVRSSKHGGSGSPHFSHEETVA